MAWPVEFVCWQACGLAIKFFFLFFFGCWQAGRQPGYVSMFVLVAGICNLATLGSVCWQACGLATWVCLLAGMWPGYLGLSAGRHLWPGYLGLSAGRHLWPGYLGMCVAWLLRSVLISIGLIR